MSVTLATLTQRALAFLDQSADAEIAALPTGTDATNAISTAEMIALSIKEGVRIIATGCWPIYGSAAKTVGSGTLTVNPQEMETGDGSILWSVRSVRYDGATLEFLSRAMLESYFPGWGSASGTPKYWSPMGNGPFLISPRTAADNRALNADGLMIPATSTEGSATFDWFPDERVDMLARYAAGMVALKNLNDPTLYPMAQHNLALFDRDALELWMRLDPVLRETEFPNPPASVIQVGGGEG